MHKDYITVIQQDGRSYWVRNASVGVDEPQGFWPPPANPELVPCPEIPDQEDSPCDTLWGVVRRDDAGWYIRRDRCEDGEPGPLAIERSGFCQGEDATEQWWREELTPTFVSSHELIYLCPACQDQRGLDL